MTAKKKPAIKDTTGLLDSLVESLMKNGSVRLIHFGTFRTKTIKGRKVYDWKKRAMRPIPPFKQVIFTPAKGLRDMLNKPRDG